MKNLIIVGAGGFGLEVAAYAEDITRAGKDALQILGFLDDTKPVGALHAGFPVLGDTNAAPVAEAVYVLAVGTPEGRAALADKLERKGAQFVSLIHPAAYVSATATLGLGAVLAPFSLIGPATFIGDHALFNVYATAGHEARLGKCCVLSPYASAHGEARLGDKVFIGGHGFVTARVKVGDNAKIAAGAVVYSDVPSGALAIGNPAAFRQT